MKWAGTNSPMVNCARARKGSFKALITIDRGLEFQQNLKKLSIGIVVVEVRKNQIPYFRAIEAELLVAVEKVAPGEVVHVLGLPF